MRTQETKQETPRFTHNCTHCEYLGRHKEYDLYFCSSQETLIARYGNGGANYISGNIENEYKKNKPLYEVKQRVLNNQLLELEKIRLRQLASGAQNWAKRTEEKINMILSNNI